MWYYGRDGKQSGPIAESELKRMIADKELGPGDLVWKQGMANWVPAGSVPELMPETAASGATFEVAPAAERAMPTSAAATSAPAAATSSKAASAPPPITAELAEKARQFATEASRDALAAFRILLSNPVGGFKDAYEKLGKFRAMQVGIVFSLVFYLCEILGGYVWFRSISAKPPTFGESFGRLFWLAGLGLVPVVCVVLLTMLCRRMFRGVGSVDSDIFVTGASLLPTGVALLLASLLGSGNTTMTLILQSVGTSFTVMMLYSGCTNVLRIPEAASTVAVAIMFLPCAFTMQWILGTL